VSVLLSLLLPCSQDFLNNVCTNIIHMHKKQLQYYSGNYDQYVQTRAELEENQMKKYKWEQDQIAHMKVGQQVSLLQQTVCLPGANGLHIIVQLLAGTALPCGRVLCLDN
jgi:hypothetical protein